MPEPQPSPSRTARLLFLGLLAGPVLFTGIALALLPRQTPVDQPVLLYMPFSLAAVLFGGGLVIRTRIPPRTPSESEDAWWRANLPRALILWRLLEGPSLFAAVMYLTLGTLLPLLVTATGIAMLMLHAPARLMDQ